MANENDDMGLELSSISMFTNKKPSDTSDPFFVSAWAPIVSQATSMASHTEFPNSHYHLLMQNQRMAGTSHVSQYQSAVGNLSEMIGPFNVPQCSQIGNNRCPRDCDLNTEGSNLDEHPISEGGVVATLPDGKILKRAAESNSPLRSHKNGDEEPLEDPSIDGCDVPKQQDRKKPKIEHNTVPNSHDKQAAKQDNYIHVRARRGQATNSHSLAERVRREKISERMRLLQELVPGCNKITGKTVMLDEIINYVQSLQHQVEFLSMKLATVNPELNLDLDRILSKDIIQARGGSAAVVGFGPGTNSSHAFSPSGIPSTNPQFASLPQTVLDNELQNLFQMGFGTKW